MTKSWQGKRTDFLVVLLYLLGQGVLIHVLVAFRQSLRVRHQQDFDEALTNPGTFVITIILLLVFVSPIGIYFKKVPRKLVLNLTDRKLELEKHGKTLRYNMDYIRFCQRSTTFFFILEIHATFQTSRNGPLEKLATVIIVPNWGLSWNKKVMTEIVREFKDAGIPEIFERKPISISDYFRN